MTEDFLHYLWRHQRFNKPFIQTEEGETLQIVHPGHPNLGGGPDFKEAKIYLTGQLWAGHIEIHLQSSDWKRHKHDLDPAYNNVILHVVFHHDHEVKTAQGRKPATLCLKGFFEEFEYWRYEQLRSGEGEIACANWFGAIDPLYKAQMLDRMALERLETKLSWLGEILEHNQGDWDSTFTSAVAYGFGLKQNSENLLRLSQQISPKIWRSYRDDQMMMAALWLGSAGLLSEQDDYTRELIEIYRFLNHKHQLSTEPKIHWQYKGIRPASFPDRRIAQLASLLCRPNFNWAFYTEEVSFTTIVQSFQLELDPYWQSHYRLGRESSRKTSLSLGKSFIYRLLSNVVIPMIYLYGKEQAKPDLKERALEFWQRIPSEKNSIIRPYEQLGLSISSSYDSQAIIHWHRHYCQLKKCLNCAIGVKILNQ